MCYLRIFFYAFATNRKHRKKFHSVLLHSSLAIQRDKKIHPPFPNSLVKRSYPGMPFLGIPAEFGDPLRSVLCNAHPCFKNGSDNFFFTSNNFVLGSTGTHCWAGLSLTQLLQPPRELPCSLCQLWILAEIFSQPLSADKRNHL